MANEKQVVKVNFNEMVNVLKGVKLNQFVNVVTLTVPSMLKTDNPFYNKETKTFNVQKLSSTNYRTSNYEQRVQGNMEKEGLDGQTFESSKPTGKSHVQGSECLLVSDKDPNVFYFMVERFDEIKPQVTYLKDGQPMNEIDRMILNDFLSKSYDSKKQEQDRKVSVITPLVSNIKSLTYNGMVYEME